MDSKFIESIDTINGRFDIVLTDDLTKYIVTSIKHELTFDFKFYSTAVNFIKLTESSETWDTLHEEILVEYDEDLW